MTIPAGGDDLPSWAPTLEQVAAYVPSRPLVPMPDGSNTDLMGFDTTTRPTAAQVRVLVQAAINWVLSATGPLDVTLYTTAADCVALRAAAFVELGYPERNDPMKDTANQTSDRLFKQADQMWTLLVARNKALTGADGDDPDGVFEIVPLYSFPSAVDYGDHLTF